MAQDDQVRSDQVQGDQPTAAPQTPPETTPVESAAAPAATANAPAAGDLSPAERNELEQLRAERDARLAEQSAQENTATPPDVGQPPAAATAVADAGPEADELPYGTHACPECGALVAVQYPGYADPEARRREVICENGHRFFPSSKTRARARS